MDPEAPSRGDINVETIHHDAAFFFVSVTHNFYTEGRQIYAVNVTFQR
jgi:protein-disulfide isomerase-like protein with CxxC motif